MSGDPLPRVIPKEAIAFFRAKGFRFGFDWRDVWQGEHAKAFTVAKAMTIDLLQDIRAALDEALGEGKTLADFTKDLRPQLERRGWWGKKQMLDPQTGEHKRVQLGSPRRLKVIFETNMRTAYQAGRWERIQRTKAAFPFLRYASVMDGKERPEHHAWHGTILPVDHPWWDTHYGPCDWGCRCTAQPLNQRMMERRGYAVKQPPQFPMESYLNQRTGEITKIERGIGPGWSYNVGQAYLDPVAPAPLPENGAGDITAAAAAPESLKIFMESFGGEGVWTDRAGWPIAIAPGWFRRPDGRVAMPDDAREPQRLADTLRNPEAIGWVWIRDEQKNPLLMRRYVSTIDGRPFSVDVGRAGWRATGRVDRRRLEAKMIVIDRRAA